MIAPNFSPLVNHMWQSSLFAFLAGLLVLWLKKHQAQARHWLWLSASVKFLIPFSLLIALGNQFGWFHTPKVSVRQYTVMAEDIRQVFVPLDLAAGAGGSANQPWPSLPMAISTMLLAIWACGSTAVLFYWWLRWRRVQAAIRGAALLREGREVEALRRVERLAGIDKPVELVTSAASLEPGVVGLFRPVLFLPHGLANGLTDTQLESILAHEVCHIRRRDNLWASIHMLVEAIFWFHPLVWWLGARMVEERERACDEEVLRLGSQPQVYAEGILSVCKFYLESPLACAAGVTGADLKKRIEEIMNHRSGKKLDTSKRMLLTAFGIAAVAGPIVIGLVNAPSSRAQEQPKPPAAGGPTEFEVASIKPGDPAARGMRVRIAPGGRYTAENVTAKLLIQQAFNIKEFQISGGPGWIDSERYVIEAKAEGATGRVDALRPMLQKLLADRFQFVFHRETKEGQVYALVVGKNGPKLKEAAAASPGPQISIRPGAISGQGMGMDMLVNQLAQRLGRNVIDKTGLTGKYDINLEWTPEAAQLRSPGEGPEASAPPDQSGPSIFTAVQEQLGLRLESTKGPVEVIVIDRIEKPSEN